MSILEEICISKWSTIKQNKRLRSEQQLLSEIKHLPKCLPFRESLYNKSASKNIGLIAEIKKASPSHGLIREEFDVVKIADCYAKGGATCLSILTDVPYFQGDDRNIALARTATNLPILRKDFMLDSYQILESRALGADCVLLIIAALDAKQALELFQTAKELAMDVLVEVHDENELETALNYLPVDMIGINHRNLKTLDVSLETSERLAKYIPADCLRIAESGITSNADCKRLAASDIYCFLVGESLMREQDISQATRKLIGG